MRLSLCLALLVALVCAELAAQPCTGIRGMVLDAATKEPLPGANIISKHNNTLGTTTSASGAFEIQTSLHDTLIITFIGYKTAVVEIRQCSLEVFLNPVSTAVGEITIRAERLIAEEFSAHKIKQLDIYTNPSAKADPILAVNALPAATTLDESANISLRGGSPAETGVFLNQVPIQDAVRYSQLNGIGTFSIFNTALIKDVQVYPGNPPLEFGHSTSGLIALETSETIPSRNTFVTSATLANAGFFATHKIRKSAALTAFSNLQHSKAFRSLNASALRNIRQFRSVDVGLHYIVSISPTLLVKAFNYTLHESYLFLHHHPTYTGIFQQKKDRNFSILNVRKRIQNITVDLNQGLSFSKAAYVYLPLDIQHSLNDYFASLNLHHQTNIMEWKTGISLSQKRSAQEGTFPEYGFAFGEGFPAVAFRSEEQIRSPEGYAYAKYFVNRIWIAGAGIRKNFPLKDDNHFFSWQGNLTFQPREAWKIIASAGDYAKYQLGQGENHQPALFQARQYSIDMLYQTHRTNWSTAVFHRQSSTGEQERDLVGAELFIRHTINHAWRLQSSLTSLRAKDFVEKISKPSPYNIHYFFRGNAEYKWRGVWTFTLVYLVRQGSYYTPIVNATYHEVLGVYQPMAGSPTRLPPYAIIDFSASRIFMLRNKYTGVAFVSIGNLLNRKNVRDYYYNFDYTSRHPNLFSERVFYFGVVLNF